MENTNEKIDSLSVKDKESVEVIKKWLVANRGYKDYDFDNEFTESKIVPLLKFVNHGEILFKGAEITQKLRSPLQMENAKGEVVSEITELKYKARYRDRELQNETKGINVSKEPMKYINAQIAVLTGNSIGVIGKLWDVDAGNCKLISSLYFLG